ncbi:hypothetical protein ALC62_12225, partial [Cyphomyrmex costatus]
PRGPSWTPNALRVWRSEALMTTRGDGRECSGHVAIRLLGPVHERERERERNQLTTAMERYINASTYRKVAFVSLQNRSTSTRHCVTTFGIVKTT